MLKTMAAVALLFLLSLPADARRNSGRVVQDRALCGRCLELDNETLPDKHYFPPIDADATEPAAPRLGNASTISAHLWSAGVSHSDPGSSSVESWIREKGKGGAERHGEPTAEPADTQHGEWAWGGIRECNRGPEGKISAGCHEAQYDNLLCNSHYDDCDDELFALAVDAVRNQDAGALRKLIGHEGSTVIVNRKRESIQLIGCTGDIVGNLPISVELLRAIL